MITTLNIYSFIPLYIPLLHGLWTDYKMCYELSAPRYYFLVRLKITIIINIVLFLVVMSMMGKYSKGRKILGFKMEIEDRIITNITKWKEEDEKLEKEEKKRKEIIERMENPKQ